MAQQEVSTGIGLRRVRVALRDTDGAIDVPAGQAVATAYNGLRISGALALTMTVPDPQRVVASGDDRAYHTFQLPPTETPTGELRVSKVNTDIVALLTDTKEFGSDPVRKVGFATDKQGEEPAIVMWGSRQAIDSEEESATFGRQIWQTCFFMNTLASLRPPAMERAVVGEMIYAIAANDSAVDSLGTLFTSALHGFTKAPFIWIVTRDKYMLDAFVGDGATTVFTLSETPSTNDVTNVTVDGVVQQETADWTVSGNVLTMVAAPAAAEKLIIEYTYA